MVYFLLEIKFVPSLRFIIINLPGYLELNRHIFICTLIDLKFADLNKKRQHAGVGEIRWTGNVPVTMVIKLWTKLFALTTCMLYNNNIEIPSLYINNINDLLLFPVWSFLFCVLMIQC